MKLPDEYLDERGVYAVVAGKFPERYLTDGIKEFMADQGITVDKSGTFQDRAGDNWKWRDIGGTWMIAYIQHACNLLAEQTEDEDMTDYVIASGRFTAKFMLSQAAKQTWYYTALDIPQRGDIWDDWNYDGQRRNELGEGPRHSGWYTRFFPDCLARAYSWTGETLLLEKHQARRRVSLPPTFLICQVRSLSSPSAVSMTAATEATLVMCSRRSRKYDRWR